MGKWLKRLGIVILAAGMISLWGLVRDAGTLGRELLRLHVVADSDEAQDQQLKLRVRDAVLESLEQGLSDLVDPQEAFAYVERMLPALEDRANQVLQQWGAEDRAQVRLTREAYPVRHYETFSLPSGIYHSLQVVIGEGKGKNWWCVVFPQLCTPTEGEFEEAAQCAAFSDSLQKTLAGEYEIRFWLLDQLGKLEKFLERH